MAGCSRHRHAYMHYLFSEERLDLRAEMFLLRSVPALASMAEGHDYKHFVLYSALLPEAAPGICCSRPLPATRSWSRWSGTR